MSWFDTVFATNFSLRMAEPASTKIPPWFEAFPPQNPSLLGLSQTTSSSPCSFLMLYSLGWGIPRAPETPQTLDGSVEIVPHGHTLRRFQNGTSFVAAALRFVFCTIYSLLKS